MSQLTAQLLGQKQCRATGRWADAMATVADRLIAEHGCPQLGNFRDPVKEIFYILLSARTNEVLYQRAQKRLFAHFRTVGAIAAADVASILNCIAGAGLGTKRAAQVLSTAQRLVSDFGRRPQSELRRLTAQDAYLYLTALPGVGPKSALCVMMWSLDFDVFPVDANVQRILERIGLIRRNAKHYQAQQTLPKFVPPGRSRELHGAMMVHGRKVCTPRRPKCEICVIADICSTGRRANAIIELGEVC